MHKHQFRGDKTRTKLCEFPPCQLCFRRIVLAIYTVAAVVEWCVNQFRPQFKRNVAKEWWYAGRRLEHGYVGVAGEHRLGGNQDACDIGEKKRGDEYSYPSSGGPRALCWPLLISAILTLRKERWR